MGGYLADCTGRQLLRSVGGFFGLTQESQRGNEGAIGWQEYAERNIEVRNIVTSLSKHGMVLWGVWDVDMMQFPAGNHTAHDPPY